MHLLNDLPRLAVADTQQGSAEDPEYVFLVLANVDLRARFRKREEINHQGAFFELFCHELLYRSNFDVEVHPKLPNGNIIIDGNKLLQQLGVIQYQQKAAENQ